MKCPQCQAESPTGTRFCGQCAAPLASVCPSCGASNPPENKFCGQCAVRLDKPAQPHFVAPESYTPKHLAEKILTSRSALEGERKQVTVLFADLKGSMELLADRDPEEARKILDPVLERMMEAVHRYEGTVNQVMGDGIMALFGAPLAHEDHAVRACYAALRMQESVKRYAESVRPEEGVTVRIRVGLNSGEVVVRAIGSDLHMDYTAVGQTTHLAARMEQMAKPGTILIPAATLSLAESHVVVNPLGLRSVKGLDAPIEVYEVTGAGAARSRLHAAAARGLTRFVGRTHEFEHLRRALDRARAGHGQIVAVVGEPGVGKSRLYWEFTHSNQTQREGGISPIDFPRHWLILESRSVSYGKSISYLPVSNLLRAYFEIDARDGVPTIREKVTSKLLALEQSVAAAAPALLAVLDVPVDEPGWQSLEPPQRRQQTLDAIKRLLFRESQIQPLLLVFEDLHWIDSETQIVLDVLVESLPAARVLLLVNYRPEYQHAWTNRTCYSQLRMDPLQSESAEDLLDELLGPDPSVEPLKPLLIERTGGNPFFLEECVQTLMETHFLVGERGACHLSRSIETIQVPASVQTILAARIDRLPSEEKHLLQAAAVIGEEVPFTLLSEISDAPEETLHQGLAHLRAAEFLYEARLFPDLLYAFKHGLTCQVTYSSLLQERRRALHARIVQALEQLGPDRRAEHIERLAHHAVRGELWEKAVTYLRQAGAKAVACSANREAIAYFEQALRALEHLPEGRNRLEQAYELRIYRVGACYSLAELGRAVDYLGEAEALARSLEDQARQARVAVLMLGCLAPMGDQARAIESGERGLAIAEAAGNLPLRISATILLGFAHIGLGDFPRAITFLRKSAAFLEGQPVHRRFGQIGLPAVFWRAWLMTPLAEIGAFHEGVTRGEEAVRIAEAEAQPYSLALVHGTLGHLYCVKGELSSGILVLERSVTLCRDHELAVLSPFTIGSLGYAYALAGRFPEALPTMEEAVARGASLRLMWWQSRRMTQLSEGYLLAGRMEDAMTTAERALVLADAHGERANRAHALRLLGEIVAHRDPSDIAVIKSHYHQAIGLADELGMRPLVAHCHLGLSKLYRRTGQRQQAQEHLTGATTMYREMEMTYWLEQAEAEVKESM